MMDYMVMMRTEKDGLVVGCFDSDVFVLGLDEVVLTWGCSNKQVMRINRQIAGAESSTLSDIWR